MPEKGMRKYLRLSGGENDLFIAENHPVLDNFTWQVGFFLVEVDKPVEHSSHGRPNKFVEVGDQITITPYKVVDKPVEKPNKNDKSNENRVFGGNKNNSSQPAEKEITN
jgi:hypothetical protein